jgi:hypothetical protein
VSSERLYKVITGDGLLPFADKSSIIALNYLSFMKFFSDMRLLILAIWLGAAVFFIGVAQSAFAVIEQRELAGSVVGRNLTILHFGGMVIAVLLIVMSLVGSGKVSKFWLWVERFLLLIIGSSCAVGQFVIGFWLSSIRAQIGRPIDEVATDDPLRIQFNTLHQYSEWVLLIAMAAALIAFFIIANRKFNKLTDTADGVYDFSKEFKN